MPRDLFAPKRPAAAHAFTIRARSRARWRGPSFDAYDAQARLGIAVAEALGVDVRDRAAMDAFLERVAIDVERSAPDANPEAPFDPEEGEAWWFHVRLHDALPEDRLRGVKAAARDAVDAARNYSDARVVDDEAG